MAPDASEDYVIQTDASLKSISAVLNQKGPDGKLHVVAYCSRKLLPRESRYSATERELLAIIHVLVTYEQFLYGHKLKIQTDCRPLAWLQSLSKFNDRLQRWNLILQNWDFNHRI